jgi:hypothetical protein
VNLRALAVSAALAASMVLLTGCFGSPPAPTPTPTAAFASEAEAFAAAEETYRAYIDAVNARWADRQSSPPPEEFLIGEALATELEVEREFVEAGIRIEGENTVERVDRISARPSVGAVVLDVCVNAEQSRVLNEADQDVTPTDRAPRVLVRVDFAHVGTDTFIERSVTAKEDGC